MRAQLVAALACTATDRRSAAIELRTAFTEAEQRAAAEQERQGARLLIDAEPLHHTVVCGADVDLQRTRGRRGRRRQANAQLAATNRARVRQLSNPSRRRGPCPFHE
jgi:hypothetical protein